MRKEAVSSEAASFRIIGSWKQIVVNFSVQTRRGGMANEAD